MSWDTPKNDWAVPDIVQTTDMNEIGNNLIRLHRGNEQNSVVSIVSADSLLLPNEYDQTFIVTGNTSISFISREYRGISNHLTLVFETSNTIYLYHEASPIPSNYAAIRNSTLTGLEVSPYDAIQLALIGSYWYPLRID